MMTYFLSDSTDMYTICLKTIAMKSGKNGGVPTDYHPAKSPGYFVYQLYLRCLLVIIVVSVGDKRAWLAIDDFNGKV